MLLVGCSAAKTSLTLAPTQGITPFRLPPTWTPTITFTPRASATSIMIETFTPVPPIPTLSQYTQTADPNDLWKNYIASPSPNGEWMAYHNFNVIKIVNDTTGKVWTLPCELFERCSYIVPIKWAQNNEVLFFGASSFLGGLPQASSISFFSSAGKINVKTGKWERLFPDPTGRFDFSVSPDDTYVAYAQSEFEEPFDPLPVRLTILNLQSHQGQTYTLEKTEGGNIVWSPYKERFIFQIRDPKEGSSIVYYDVDADILRYIVKNKKSDFSIQSWLENNLVLIQETDWKTQESSLWYLNPFTNEFSVAPTPTVTP